MEPITIGALSAAGVASILWVTAMLRASKLKQQAASAAAARKELATTKSAAEKLQAEVVLLKAQNASAPARTPLVVEQPPKQDAEVADLKAALGQQKSVIDLLEDHIKQLEAQVQAAPTASAPHIEDLTPVVNDLKGQLRDLEQQLTAAKSEAAHIAKGGIDLEAHPVGEHPDETLHDMLIANGKMATLGTLVAGVAHELNTPLGAITAAGESLGKTIPGLLNDYPGFFNSLGPDQQKGYFALVERSLEAPKNFSSREERQYKKDITEKLVSLRIDDAENMAKTLVKGGIINGYEEFVPLLQHPQRELIFDMVGTAVKIKQNIDNIQLASRKMDRMVKGLRNYSHSGGDKFEPTNLRENIETVLTLYHNKLKYGVEVTTHYPDKLPPIMAVSDELTQVWTNLISNAVQAMNATGKLDIDVTLPDARHISVAITDSGSGIAPEVLPRIFEPFFTTKAKGEGTGLGLDICKKIVEKHKGSMAAVSQPGRTTFTVLIPTYEGDMPVRGNMEGGIVGELKPIV